MTVLSDKTIKEMIAQKRLIPSGNAGSAEFCSYEFTAAVMLRGGSGCFELIDRLGIEIKPAELVWVKASEEISVPPNMVGLWIQTQTLARQGLLLLNISIIEPGYQGPLTAVLVNFGSNNVTVSLDTKIAKVVFLLLDRDATKLVGKWDTNDYDDKLREMVARSPNTFLQLQSFEMKAKDILDLMKREMEQSVKSMADLAKDKIIDDLQSDLRGTLLKWGGLVAAGLLIGCTIVWLMMSSYLPRLSEYSKFDELARRAAMTQQVETITGISTQLSTLTTEIESLKKQMQSDATNTNPLSDANNAVPNQ